MATETQKIFGSMFLLFVLNHFIIKSLKEEVKIEQSETIKSAENVKKQILQDIAVSAQTLKKEMEVETQNFVEDKLRESEQTGTILPEVMNIMSHKLKYISEGELKASAFDPYNNLPSLLSDESGQIKYEDLPGFFKIDVSSEKLHEESKNKLAKKQLEPKSYHIDNTVFYNPGSNDKFGFVEASGNCDNYATF